MRQQCRRGLHENCPSRGAAQALHSPRHIGGALRISWFFRRRVAPSANAAGLECPEIGHTGVPDLTGDPTRAKLLVGGSGIDLANEINELINEVQLKEPGISSADLTNGLIAAYCPLVAQ